MRMLDHPDDAADAVQEALIAALRRAHTYRGEASVRTWLCRITVNVCIDRIRRDRLRPTEAWGDREPSSGVDHAGRVVTRMAVDEALAQPDRRAAGGGGPRRRAGLVGRRGRAAGRGAAGHGEEPLRAGPHPPGRAARPPQGGAPMTGESPAPRHPPARRPRRGAARRGHRTRGAGGGRGRSGRPRRARRPRRHPGRARRPARPPGTARPRRALVRGAGRGAVPPARARLSRSATAPEQGTPALSDAATDHRATPAVAAAPRPSTAHPTPAESSTPAPPHRPHRTRERRRPTTTLPPSPTPRPPADPHRPTAADRPDQATGRPHRRSRPPRYAVGPAAPRHTPAARAPDAAAARPPAPSGRARRRPARRRRGRRRRCGPAPRPRPTVGRPQLVAEALSAVGVRDTGGLDDPTRRAGCLRAVGAARREPGRPAARRPPGDVRGRAGRAARPRHRPPRHL